VAARNRIDIEINADDKASAKVHNLLGTLDSLGSVVSGFRDAVDMISNVGHAVVDMVKDAAGVEVVQKAFEGLAKSSGKSADAMLKALEKGSAGMVAQKDLMKTYNLAAQLVGTTFANQLPDAMGYLQKVSAATGQDMGFMLESLTRGVGRLSPMILDNLGIQVDLTKAYEDYAKSIGKSVDGLTKQEQQTALTNQVMEKLAENTANMPDIADSAAAKFAQFDAKMQNLRDTIGMLLLPVFSKFLDVAIGGLDLLTNKLPKVVDFFAMLGRVLTGGADWSALFVKMREAFGDAFTDAFINAKTVVENALRGIVDAVNGFDLSGMLATFGDNLKAEIEKLLGVKIDTAPLKKAWDGLLKNIRGIISFHIDDLGIVEGRDRFADYVREIFDLSNYTVDLSGIGRVWDSLLHTIRYIISYKIIGFDITDERELFDARVREIFSLPNFTVDLSALEQAGSNIRDAVTRAMADVQGATVDTAGVEAWATDNFDKILAIVVSVAGIIFGGPIGLAIGGARLIAEAINSDFLGIGTFLDESGIKGAIEGVFNDIKGFVEDLAARIFGGGGEPSTNPMAEYLNTLGGGGMDLSDPLQRFANNLRKGIEIIKDVLAGVGADIGKGLSDLMEGIKGFIENLAGADTGGLLDILTVVGGAIGGFLTALISVGGAAVGGLLSAVGEALPLLGTALKDFISAISALGEGDIGGALTNLGNGIGNIISAIGNFVGSIADSVISFLERLLGLDLPSVSEIGQGIADFLSGLGLNLDALKVNFELVWEGIRLAVENAWNWLKTNVFDPIINIFVVDIPAAGAALGENIALVWTGIQTAIKTVWDFISLNIFTPIKSWIDNFVMFTWPSLKTAVEDAWNGIKVAMEAVWNFIRDNIITPLINAINSIIDTVKTVADGIGAALQPITDAFEATFGAIIDFIQGAIDKITELLGMQDDAAAVSEGAIPETFPGGGPDLGIPGGLPLPGQQLGGYWPGGPVSIEPRAGPETFWPNSAGQFLPNAGGAGAGGSLTINFNGSGGPASQAEADGMADMIVFALRERGLAVPR